MSRPRPSSRANGRLSQGPKTQAGKDRVKFNALRHGFCAQQAVVLCTESAEDFDRLLDAHHQRFQPQDEIEADAVDDLAAARWRLHRLQTIETSLMDQALGAKPDLADAFTAIAENRAFELLLRYDARLQSTFQRSLRTLIQLREKLPAAEPLEDTAEPTLKAMAA